MRIFLSYASEDRALAEEIQLALSGPGYDVFFDESSLPPGADYHSRIAYAVEESDIFVFLISPNSVTPGSYALTELKFARTKWPHPKGRILSVRLRNIDWAKIPPYLRSVTVLDTEGNIPAEIRAAVVQMAKSIEKQSLLVDSNIDKQPVKPWWRRRSYVLLILILFLVAPIIYKVWISDMIDTMTNASHPLGVGINYFNGQWENITLGDPRGPSRLDIRLDTGTSGTTIYVRGWKFCIPSECDLGEVQALIYTQNEAPPSNEEILGLEATFQTRPKKTRFFIQPEQNNKLKVETSYPLSDTSRRAIRFVGQDSILRRVRR